MKKQLAILGAALSALLMVTAAGADDMMSEEYKVISGIWETVDGKIMSNDPVTNDNMAYYDRFIESDEAFAFSADAVLSDDCGDNAGAASLAIITGDVADPIGTGILIQRTDYRNDTMLWGLNSTTNVNVRAAFPRYELGDVIHYDLVYDGNGNFYSIVNGKLYLECLDCVFDGGYPGFLMWNGTGYYTNVTFTNDISAFDIDALRAANEAEAAAAEAAKNAEAQKRVDEGFIESISTPITTYDNMDDNVGGGSKTLSTINDGYIMVEGDAWNKQFDTVCNTGKWIPGHEEYIGYEFPGTYTVEYVDFTEGGNFFDGGFFANGELRLEALIGGEWTNVECTVSPEYPEGETQEDFLPNFETYTLTPNSPVECDGIRVIGVAGGSAFFISCTELVVKTQVAEKAEAPVAEPVQEDKPAETEPAEVKPAETEAVEAPAEPAEKTETITAPQTFDMAAVCAAAMSVMGLAAYSVRKRK